MASRELVTCSRAWCVTNCGSGAVEHGAARCPAVCLLGRPGMVTLVSVREIWFLAIVWRPGEVKSGGLYVLAGAKP